MATATQAEPVTTVKEKRGGGNPLGLRQDAPVDVGIRQAATIVEREVRGLPPMASGHPPRMAGGWVPYCRRVGRTPSGTSQRRPEHARRLFGPEAIGHRANPSVGHGA